MATMRIKWLICIALCLPCWSSINTSNYNAVKSEDEIIYALFEDMFTEPIEVIYFLMDDMALYKVTSNDEKGIYINMWLLKKDFKQNGHTFSDVIVIIHNHTKDTYFSNNDIDAYRTFKDAGFEGKFFLYVYRTKTIYELDESWR